MGRFNLFQTAWAHVVLIALAAAVVYLRTLGVPFYLDDFSSVRENPLVYHWQGLGALWHFAPTRVVCYLTFVLDYRVGHFEPARYHITNLLVHVLAGIAVYALARGLVRTPRLRRAMPPLARGGLPLVTALLFVLHPLQTQAVTYIVQRLASLAALFYLAALAAYVQFRLAAPGARRSAWVVMGVLAGVLGCFAKENCATLPVAIVLVEAAFFAPGHRRLLVTAAVAGAALVTYGMAVAIWHAPYPLRIDTIAGLSQATPDLTRGRYFATQMIVVVHYLRLFVLPAGLHLDYDLALRDGFWRPDVLFGGVVHLALIACAIVSWRRRPVIAFGVLFYYLAQTVESTIIPIGDLVFEHRTYLPNFGLCLVTAWLLLAELPRTRVGARVTVPVTVIVILALGFATWRRNELWRDPIAFWRSNVALAPDKPRPLTMLGRALIEANRPAEGLQALERAVQLKSAPAMDDDFQLTALDMMSALTRLGRYEEALAWNARATASPMNPVWRASFYTNEGDVYRNQLRWREAEGAYREAVRLAPNNITPMERLASACSQTGKLGEAEQLFASVLTVNPADPVVRANGYRVRAQAQVNLGNSRLRDGQTAAALTAFRAALAALDEADRLMPGDREARENTRVVRQFVESLEAAGRALKGAR
jgi:tetratricopeptide (TPR) repeat protein